MITLENGNTLSLEALSETTFRVRVCKPGDGESALNRYGMIDKLPAPRCEAREEDGFLTLATERASLRAELSTGHFSLRGADGTTLLETAFAPENDRKGFRVGFALLPEERVYGLGDVTRERVNKRGHRAEMWVKNVNSYVPIPFAISERGWGLFLNTTWRSRFDVGAANPDLLEIEGDGGALDLYLFAGGDYEARLSAYTDLLGKPAMLPRWAYGLTYVCNQQVNAFEMMQECLNFRREGIPCDVCGLEPGWMSQHYDFTVDKKWDPERFYIPPWSPKGDQTFFGALNRLGFKLSLWLCCDYDLSFEEERRLREISAPERAEARSEDDFEQDDAFATGKLSMDRITKPGQAWFEHLKKFVDQGARCFKLDGANQVLEHPDRKWGNGMDDAEMHNLYPLLLNKQMGRGFAEYTKLRPMIYSSGGYAGIQRYTATWAGDTGGGAKPLASMLNHGFSGHVNTSCDMDIFTPGGIHFGFFQPWSQLCNWAYWRQPWFLAEPRKLTYRFYARLRYRLLPYVYTAAHRASMTGYPLMRAMPMAYPNMRGADELMCQYLFGDDLLTAAFAESVTLPEGAWYDAWTNQAVTGGATFAASWPQTLDGPLYVRAGAIIPSAEIGDFIGGFIGDKQPETVELNLYPDAEARAYTLYEDDGETEAYRGGACAKTKITCVERNGEIRLTIAKREGDYANMPAKRAYAIRIMTHAQAKALTVNGERAAWRAERDGLFGRVESGFVAFDAEEAEGGLEITLQV